jgi:glycosyltransferase 2 family protein
MVKLDWKTGAGIAVSVLLLWWVMKGVDAREVWFHLKSGNLWLLAAAVAVATSGFLLRALRWRLLLHPLSPDTSLRNRFTAVNIGFAANNLLPARIGEVARCWAIARLEKVSLSGAVGSLVVERFLDGVAVFSLLAVALLHPGFPLDATVGGQPIRALVYTVLLFMGVVLTVVVALLLAPTVVLGMARQGAKWLPEKAGSRLVGGIEQFLTGLDALRDPKLLVGALLWSFGFWGWNAVSFWLAFHAFGIDEIYWTALFVQAVIALGVAVPSAPGFFGTFHAAAVIGLSEVHGVAEGPTLAFAFGYHLGGFIPVTLMGLWGLSTMGIRMRDLKGVRGS